MTDEREKQIVTAELLYIQRARNNFYMIDERKINNNYKNVYSIISYNYKKNNNYM